MLIDISQEIFGCRVYPGDPEPVRERLADMERGDSCNLSAFSMCAHNGTHIDAPLHFIRGGKTVAGCGLEPFVGPCFVARRAGELTVEDAKELLETAEASGAARRLLIAGEITVTAAAARVFASAKPLLLGCESQSFGPVNAPAEVHRILLGAEVVLLEGLVLDRAEEGTYFLSAAPLNLGDCEGAPCRAVLWRPEE